MLIAHRGAVEGSGLKENTLKAFHRVMTSGSADGFECDLRLTSDGEIVIQHDPTIDNIPIEDMHSVEVPSDMCFLGELLTLIRDLGYQGLVNLEVKTYKTGSLAARMILSDFPQLEHHRILFTSFLHPEIMQMKHSFPTFRYGLLLACQPIAGILDQLLNSCDCIVIRDSVVDWNIMSGTSPNRVYLWTVNCLTKVKKLRDQGYHVITDILK